MGVLQDYFHIHGLGRHVRDKTTDEKAWCGDRAEQIREYLDTHPEIERFVIVDDQYKRELEEMFPGKHVHTSYRLEAADDRKAREILSGRAIDSGTETGERR